MSKKGVLHGVSDIAGGYHFAVKVTDPTRGRMSATRSFSLTVSPASVRGQTSGPVSELIVSAPTAVTVGTSFLVSVTAEDASGRIVTGFIGDVTLTSSDGQSVYVQVPESLPGTVIVPVALVRADTVTLTAASGNVFGSSSRITVNAAAAFRFVVSAPSTATMGRGFSVSVTAEDALGNTATGFDGGVTLYSSDGQAVNVQSAPVLINGSAEVTVALDTADTVTLTAYSGNLYGVSGLITNSLGGASGFVVSAPSTVTADTSFSVSVTAEDAFGNALTGFQGAINLTSSDGQAVNLLSQPLFDNGTAVLDVMLDRAGTITLTAASGTATGTSGPIVNGPAAACTFAVVAPSTATAGTSFSVTVTAEDAFGNTVTTYDGGATLTSSDGQAVILPAQPVLIDGTADVTMTLDRAGTITLTAASGTATGTSGPIVDGPAAACTFAVVAPSTATAGTSFSVTVTAEDAFGNTVTTYDGGATLTSSDGQAVILPAQPLFTDGTAAVTVMLISADTVTLTAAWETIQGASTAIVVSGGGVTNDWFSQNMTDLGLQDLARSEFGRDGSITYGDVMGLFAEAESAGPLTGAELQSLQALVTTAGAAAVNMASSVQSLTYKVVDGDPANAQFLGAPSGNLAVGSSATQLQDLVDKWFLGADHPTIDLTGLSVNYAVAGGTLFGTGGPSYQDAYQGEEGDCWLIASFAETARVEPSVIQSMFTDDGTALEDGVQVQVWTVRFYDNGVASYVTVDNYLPAFNGNFIYTDMGQPISSSSNVLWVPLLEKAYAQLSESGWNMRPRSNSYASLCGGLAMQTLPFIAGAQESPSNPFGDASSFINAISSETLLTLASDVSGNSALGIVGDHDYAVLGYNASDQTFTLLNPWGWNSNYGVPGILNLTWDQITEDFWLDGNCNPVSAVSLAAGSAGLGLSGSAACR